MYAFLGHRRAASYTWKEQPMVIADYNKSVEEVYQDTASRILEIDPHSWTVVLCFDHTISSSSLSGQRFL